MRRKRGKTTQMENKKVDLRGSAASFSTPQNLSLGSIKKSLFPALAEMQRFFWHQSKNILSANKKSLYLYLLGLLIITCFIYSNSLHNELLNFDDQEYYTDYPEITHLSWHSLTLYFSRYYVIMYQPLPILSFALNYYFTKTAVFPLHLVNLIFHLMNVVLVYIFINKLAGKSLVALIVATLFAIHPMNVEAVSWFSARSSVMYTFFYLLALIFYLHYLKCPQKKYLFFTGVAFLFSLFSKSQAVTLPLVLLLLDFFHSSLHEKQAQKNYEPLAPLFYFFTGERLRSVGRALLAKMPFFALSFLFGMITILEKDTVNNITSGMLLSYTVGESFFLICYSLLFFLYKFLIPINLCAIHVYPPKINGYLPIEYYLSPLILLAAVFIFYKLAKKREYVLFGLLFFFITISINIQIIPSRLFIVSERYGYVPYLGFFFIIGEFYNELIEKGLELSLVCKRGLISLLLVICLGYSLLTMQRGPVWKDDVSLMTDIINKNPPVVYISRAYGTRGNALAAKKDLQNALRDYTKAIEMDPKDKLTYANRGLLYLRFKKYPQAIEDLNKVLGGSNPRAALLYSSRATAKYYLQDNIGALADFNKAIKLKPDLIDAHNIRAIIKYSLKDYQGAEKDFKQAKRLSPNNADLYKNNGILFLKLKQIDKACKDLTVASNLGDSSATQLKQKYC